MATHDTKDKLEAYLPDNDDGSNLIVDWTQAEEKKVKRKLDMIIMPILTLGFFCLQLDRGNISNALTDNFLKDVGVSQNQFNVGQQMLSLGIVLFEIPSNMALYRVGPGKWLTLQLFLFGLVSLFQAFQKGYSQLLATRFLLGMTESGFIPGGLWTLSTWYTRRETAKRIMVFYFGNQFGQASSKLLAYGILHMRGVGGRTGWFWLFALMGIFTLASGFVFGFFLPDSIRNPHSTFFPKLKFFNERELHILKTRIIIDDPAKGRKKKRIGRAGFKKAFSNWRLYVHVIITLCNNGPQRAFDTYSPSIVSGFGFPALTSNALASVGLFIQIPLSYTFSWVSDRYNRRGETTIAGFACHLLGNVMNRGFAELNIRGPKYFGIVWTQAFATFSHPLNIAWMSLACDDSEERALAMAMVIMGANVAGIYGAQIFREEDKPRYRRAFGINIAVLTVGLSLAVLRYVDDRRRRSVRRKSLAHESSIEHINEKHAPRLSVSDVQPQTVLIGSDFKPVAADPSVR